jgi:hypothetical protein
MIFLSILLALQLPATPEVTPDRQPQLAANGSTVAMVYGNGHSILLRRSTDSGRTFSAPVLVAQGGVLALGRHRGPRILFSGKTMIVSAVSGATEATGTHAHGLPADGDLLTWRSTDGGTTWSKPVVVNDAPGAAREGLHAMTVDGAGRLAAVWLDLRAKGTRLFGAFSNDAGATWSKNLLVYQSPDGTICQCCDPSIVAVGADEFAVMWRNALGGMRDMYLLRLRDGKVVADAHRIGEGSWKLEACPMDGGGIVADHGKLVTAWRRDDRVFLAEANGGEIELGKGKDVAITAGKKGAYVAWVGATGIEMRRPGAASAERIAAGGAFPALAALDDGSILVAWEHDGVISLQRVE